MKRIWVLLGSASPTCVALCVALIYAIVAGVWIAFSDRLLAAALDGNIRQLTLLQTYKGWLFVVAMAFLLFAVIRGLLGVARQAQAQLQQAKEDAERIGRMKDQFLAVLSHELRTPLTPALVAVGSMQRDSRLPEETREDLVLVRRNLELQTRLIDDLLDLTRINRGKVSMDCQTVDVHRLLDHALQITGDELRAKNLRVDRRLEAGTHHVSADPARLMQVFWNLLKNAVRFTPSGGTITVCTRNQDQPSDDRPGIEVEVADSGVGIEPEMLQRIFDPFEQAGSAYRGSGGLGLGLTIAKRIVELHGGTLKAYSEGRGRGARFVAALPTVAAEETVPEPPAPPAEAALEPMSILLVEDSADTARLLARLLESEGHRVRVAGTAQEAIALAAEEDFDLLISDIALPDASGIEVMRRVREKGPIKGIAISGHGQEQDVRQSIAAGFEEHLIKPIDVRRLENAIARVAADHASRQA